MTTFCTECKSDFFSIWISRKGRRRVYWLPVQKQRCERFRREVGKVGLGQVLFYLYFIRLRYKCVPRVFATNPESKLRIKTKAECTNVGRWVVRCVLTSNRDTFRTFLDVGGWGLLPVWMSQPSSSSSLTLLPSHLTTRLKPKSLSSRQKTCEDSYTDRAYTL